MQNLYRLQPGVGSRFAFRRTIWGCGDVCLCCRAPLLIRWWEPNVQNSQLLAHSWGNLWRALTDLPQYEEHMSGRVFPDFENEPRWGLVLSGSHPKPL